MAKATHHKYRLIIAGAGRFPIDMLRYANACPATETDSNAIDRTHDYCGDEGRTAVCLFRFAGEAERSLPTSIVDRFRSYGWEIVKYDPSGVF